MASSASLPLTVCIPVYEMGGRGHAFLRHSLDVLAEQTFVDFDVVVSDDSASGLIEDLCRDYASRLQIRHVKNPDPPGLASNMNNAIRHATGKILKLLCQDDFLFGPASLQTIVDHFDVGQDTWLVTGCEHTRDGTTLDIPHYPRYTEEIILGKNTIGAPSVLSIANEDPLHFDPNLRWLVDCDYYRRYHDRAGYPKVVNEIGVVVRLGEHQVTTTQVTPELIDQESRYLAEKFAGVPPPKWPAARDEDARTALATYLNDHLGAAATGRELVGRALANNRGNDYGVALEDIARQLDEDARTLLELMRRLDLETDRPSERSEGAAASVGTPNDQASTYSPLTRLTELERLVPVISGNLALWHAMRLVLAPDPRIEGVDLDALVERAKQQRRTVEGLRRRAAVEALT